MVDRIAESPSRKSSTVRATVDFEKPGKQTGFIQVPLSVHDDAWGVIPIPIAVISNGRGPTVILEAATTVTNMRDRSRWASLFVGSIQEQFRDD